MSLNATIKPRAPMVHCYRCGSSDIAGICHHCGRPMCQSHVPQLPRLLGWLQNKILTPLGLAVHSGHQPAIHCHSCSHKLQIWLGVLDILIALCGVFLAVIFFRAGQIGGWAILATAVLALVCFRAALRVIEMGRSIPLFPRMDNLKVLERVVAVATLVSGGFYTPVVERVTGSLVLKSYLDPPKIGKWQRIMLRLTRKDFGDVRFHAGFLVLHGRIGMSEAQPSQAHVTPLPSPVVSLIGRMSQVPAFMDEHGAHSGEWSVTYDYRLIHKLHRRASPVRLVPSFRPRSDRRIVEIDVQLADPGPLFGPITPQRIDRLTLYAPGDWRPARGSRSRRAPRGNGSASADSENQVPVGGADSQSGGNARTWQLLSHRRVPINDRHIAAGRRRVSFPFANEIPSDSTIRVFGQVTFQGALSGITKVSLFSALGMPVDLPEPPPVITELSITLDANLASLSYQHMRVVPDSRYPEDAKRSQPLEFKHLMPDSNTVISLTNALSRREFYIQWVVENPPHSGRPADVLNHYWDVGGRRYEGVCPVDFHLVITGDETHSTSPASGEGTTFITITVQGPYTTSDMADEVVKIWDELELLIKNTLNPLRQKRPPPGGVGTSSGSPDATGPAGEPSSARGSLGDLPEAAGSSSEVPGLAEPSSEASSAAETSTEVPAEGPPKLDD